MLGARNAESCRFQVAYDDGDRRWHDEGKKWRLQVLPAIVSVGADVVCAEEPWEKLELRCAISMQRLADPAKGERCVHRSRCNFDMLKPYVSRAKVCPIVGCDAPLARSHGVQRDDALRAALADVPAAVDVVWVKGDEVRTAPPPVATAAASGGKRRRGAAAPEQGQQRRRARVR